MAIVSHAHVPGETGGSRRLLQRSAVFVAVLGVVATYAVTVTGATASAASVTGSNFEIDTNANLKVDGAAPAIDWLATGANILRTGVVVKPDEPSGASDDSFTQGTKEDDTTPTIEDGSIPPSKSDLKNFGVYVENNAAGSFLNVFWSRVQDPTGTTNVDFEFNQLATRSNNPADGPQIIPVRKAGDLLITYDLTNGGTVATLSRRTWIGSATTGEWGPEAGFSAAQAIGSINSSLIPAAEADGLGPFDPRTFGEASVSMAALFPDDTTCFTYGSAYVKSRSSASFQAELKDFIAPVPVSISNCGSVRIHKTDANGALSGAGFTLYKDVAPTGGTRGTGDTVVAGSCTTNASGDCTISDVKQGEYWLVETTVPAGHDGVADQHVSITAAGQVVSLNLNDPIQYGTIRVTKVGVPPDGTDFSFTLDGSGFQLDDDTNGTLPSTRDFTVVVGAHSVAEVDIPDGWALTALSCTDPTSNSSTSLVGKSATLNVAKDELVACTFTNSYAPQGVPLSTQVVANAGGGWNDVATLTGDGTHAVTGTVAFFACSGQSTPTGCPTGGTKVGGDAAVTSASGATYTATTTTALAPAAAGWTCFRAVYASTSPYYQDASHTNSTTECFLTRNDALTVSTTATPAFGRAYSWTIDKGVSTTRQQIPVGSSATFDYTVSVGNTHTDSAWTVSGLVTVTNPNDVAFSGVDLTQAVTNGGICTVTNGVDVTVPANGSAQRAYSCTYAAAPSPLTGTSTATATWDAAAYFTEASSATGSAALAFGSVAPSSTDEIVTVTDSVVGSLGTVNATTDPNPKVFTYSVTVPGVAGTCTTYDNVAAFLTNDTARSGSASRSVVVCVGVDLTATATAAGTVDRTYAWTIDKTVDAASLTLPNGQDGTFTYGVTVRPAGTTDSNPVLGGTVVVTNPNTWQDVAAQVALTTDLAGGATCALTGGSSVLVPMGSSLTLPYTCSFTGVPALSGAVTALVTWDKAVFSTPTGAVSAQSPVALAVAAETNRTITVVDDKTDPNNPVTLGTATYDAGEAVFTYSLTQSGAVASTDTPTCIDYVNVAAIAETGQTDTVTATLCHTFTGGGGAPVVNPPQGGGLPTTGDAIGLLARTALGLLAAGLVLLLVSRKRRSA